MLEAFKFGFSVGLQQWRIALIVYLFQLCLAVTLGLQVMSVFDASIGNSLEINKLLQHYDHTVISDFLKIHSASVSALIGQLRWLLIIYLLFAVFIDAGLLLCSAKPREANRLLFWQGGATYFFPFLKIALVFLMLLIVWTAIVFVPFGLFLQPMMESFPNEKYIFGVLAVVFFIYFLGLSGLFSWSVLSRFWKIKTDASIATSLKNGFQTLRKNKSLYWRLIVAFFVLQVLLVLTYWLLDSLLGMTSVWLIVVMGIIQQVFSFFRVMIRQMFYAGIGQVV